MPGSYSDKPKKCKTRASARTFSGPENRPVRLALAGNPNAGKSSVFNYYTGSRQHVANYPGITVEQKTGAIKVHGQTVLLTDLPGTYSLTAYSQDELVARAGLTEGSPDCVINVLNAGALERNLYLSVQIMEMGLPMTLALNMCDEVKRQGFHINHERLSELLGVPVIPTIARTGKGLHEVLHQAMQIAERSREKKSGEEKTTAESGLVPEPAAASARHGHEPALADTGPCANCVQNTPDCARMRLSSAKVGKPLFISYGPDLDPVLTELGDMLEKAGLFGYTFLPRWVALKFLENDSEVRRLALAENPALVAELDLKIAAVKTHLSATLNTYPEAIIADYRYGFISALLKRDIIEHHDELRLRMDMSDRLDLILAHRLAGPLIMLGLIYVMYKITFGLGEIPMGWLESLFGLLGGTVADNLADGLLKSLLVSGVIDGVGSVLGFVPLILLMFLQLAFLEDSGYMARVAYMLDRVFRAFGLHGCSVMPFIISGGIAGGCAVPGVMAARTLRSPREKLATILTVPFMTCGAKLPVFLLFAHVFFPQSPTAAMLLLSLAAWITALLTALFMRSTIIRGAATPFVMELPPYRLPTLFGILIHTWERGWQYIKKAGTVILAISIVIWATMTFPVLPENILERHAAQKEFIETQIAAASNPVYMAELEDALADLESEHASAALANSLAGRLGKALEPLTSAAGLDWRANIALLGGIGAKEVIISTLGTAYSLGEASLEESESLQTRIACDPFWNKANAVAFIAFVLIYAPCIATLVTIKNETGTWKWAAFSLIFNTLLAFGVAVALYRVGTLIWL